MHLVNDMITLLPQNAAVPSSVTSPASMTSPALTCYPTGQYNAFSFNGIPSAAANLTCFQAGINGYTINGLPSAVNGYALQTIPSSCGMAPNNVTISGMSGSSASPTTPPVTNNCTITGCQNGTISLSGLAMPPPNALTAPEVYGLPPASMMTKKTSSTTSDSSSGDGSPAPLSPAASMELVWHGEFDRLFAQYFPHMWCLVPTFYPPSDSWRTFKDSAKVRFSCQECGHGWTSMKGRVVFWFDLNYATNAGCVMFKLYGQQCQRCKTGKFEHAMWYPEEVVKVIGNVYNRVGQIHYGFVRPPLRIDRRVGKPRNQHNAELCQACKEGLCKEEWSFA